MTELGYTRVRVRQERGEGAARCLLHCFVLQADQNALVGKPDRREPECPSTTRSNTTTAPACRSIREIFARWAREAEDYRAEAMKERRAELGLSYGSTPRQVIDFFLPKSDGSSPNAAGIASGAPLAMFVHGGYWRSLDPSMFSQMARGLNAHGVAVAVAGYDLCPQVTIAEIIDEVRHACLFLWLRLERRMMVYGHSAGGHLAAAMVATDWQGLYPRAPASLSGRPTRSPDCSISPRCCRQPWRKICG